VVFLTLQCWTEKNFNSIKIIYVRVYVSFIKKFIYKNFTMSVPVMHNFLSIHSTKIFFY